MIEALTTSVNYADYLAETLPTWLPFVDRVLVLTNERDEDTRRVVDAIGGSASWMHSDALGMAGPFDRGIAINQGLTALDRTGWILLIDADIALTQPIPGDRDARLLYGAVRHDVIGREQWRAILAGEGPILASRDVLRDQALTPTQRARCVRGFFQLFFAGRAGLPPYPEGYTSVDAADWAFARQWGRCRRRFPRESFAVYHLSMPGDAAAANWGGRRSPAWPASGRPAAETSIGPPHPPTQQAQS